MVEAYIFSEICNRYYNIGLNYMHIYYEHCCAICTKRPVECISIM